LIDFVFMAFLLYSVKLDFAFCFNAVDWHAFPAAAPFVDGSSLVGSSYGTISSWRRKISDEMALKKVGVCGALVSQPAPCELIRLSWQTRLDGQLRGLYEKACRPPLAPVLLQEG